MIERHTHDGLDWFRKSTCKPLLRGHLRHGDIMIYRYHEQYGTPQEAPADRKWKLMHVWKGRAVKSLPIAGDFSSIVVVAISTITFHSNLTHVILSPEKCPHFRTITTTTTTTAPVPPPPKYSLLPLLPFNNASCIIIDTRKS